MITIQLCVVCGELIESVRNDVERLFWALKNRFVWLKSNILYSKVSAITSAVNVCAILHNRLLEYDNMINFDWENIDPNTPDVELCKRYIHSTVPVPNPCIVEDPILLVPSESMRNNDATNPTTISQPIPATAIM